MLLPTKQEHFFMPMMVLSPTAPMPPLPNLYQNLYKWNSQLYSPPALPPPARIGRHYCKIITVDEKENEFIG
jgi:hypothetical protein